MCKNPNMRLLLRLIIDFVILISVACIALLVVPRMLTTQQRGFYCADETLSYPYKQPLLHRVHITILVIALPAAVLLIVEMLRVAFCREYAAPQQRFAFVGMSIPTFISECYKLFGAYLFGLALELITVEATKRTAGRLRPHFFDVCQPQLAAEAGTCTDADNHARYMHNYTCTGLAASAELLASMRHSFPSAYVATAAYAMCFVIFYLQARLSANCLRLLRIALQCTCAVLVALVGMERIYAHSSHLTDVMAGAGFGLIFGAFVAVPVLDLFYVVEGVKLRKIRSERIYGYTSSPSGSRNTPKYA